MTEKELISALYAALSEAQKHHMTTSMPQAIKNYGTLGAAREAGTNTWVNLVPTALDQARAYLTPQ